MRAERPLIAVTMGDPAGIGPELCLRLLADEGMRDECVPVVFGDATVLARCARECGLPAPADILRKEEWAERAAGLRAPAVLDLGHAMADDLVPGTVSGDNGRAAYEFIQAAIDAALAGEVAAVATAPINKEALRLAGISYP
ncbi:MAG TPA: 4-hydroxythreonine-4-phosphate dehydrogenase PdxA, partial [Methylomirabilota bacterium]|nr:4-hydroxythreonine-4-phosphate dehydrogenase PdxA [Methylomirabilota bacterium]